METFEGAVMVADISGFTRLTEQLSRGSQTAFGVELLTKCINNYFSKVRCSKFGCLGLRYKPGSGGDQKLTNKKVMALTYCYVAGNRSDWHPRRRCHEVCRYGPNALAMCMAASNPHLWGYIYSLLL